MWDEGKDLALIFVDVLCSLLDSLCCHLLTSQIGDTSAAACGPRINLGKSVDKFGAAFHATIVDCTKDFVLLQLD